jgi:DNA/RNA-binding domain of Phe-tRNA-synthetase-like protein
VIDEVRVSPEVFALRPDYVVTLVEMSEIPSGPSDDDSREQLQVSALHAQADGGDQHPHILAWHDAFRAFGARPKRARPSVDALRRRINQGLPEVNRVVDIYNAVSVAHAIPIGGEDPDRYEGHPRLILASGEESFDIFSEGILVNDSPLSGEVIWRDDRSATCRRWNWRQCVRTRITEESRRGYFLLERLEPLPLAALEAATADLVERLSKLSPGAAVQERTIGKSSA